MRGLTGRLLAAARAATARAATARPARTGRRPTRAAPAGATPTGRAPTRRGRVATTVRAAARRLSYAPQRDGAADPGEVVWAAVAYEDRPEVVKDRPVLVVGRQDARTVLGLMLSSQVSRDGQDDWLAIGSGPWDRERRPSFVRLDRVLALPDDGIRREGAVLDEERFARVSAALRARYGWQ